MQALKIYSLIKIHQLYCWVAKHKTQGDFDVSSHLMQGNGEI